MQTDITVVMIDSRSDIHPDWVTVAINSVKAQYHPVKMIVIDNRDLEYTIGQCWNQAVQKADTEWILFIGDDDWLSRDYCLCLSKFVEDDRKTRGNEYDAVTTAMTFYNPEQLPFETPQQNTGMWKREYLLKYPFNEKLKKGVDREYVEEASKRGCNTAHLNYHHGIYVRVHDTHNLTKRPELLEEPGEYVFFARMPTFIRPVVDGLKYQGHNVTLSNHDYHPEYVKNAKVIWCDWADKDAFEIARLETNAKKILRVHAYEAFTTMLYYINYNAFDKIIFVAPHIREIVETRLKRRLERATIIPNGVKVEDYEIAEGKEKNNKIAWAGQIDRKKGAQLLMFIAEHFPQYQFHIAGKFYEEDIAVYFNECKPDNLILEPYSYDLNEFFKDKTYFLNTSPREGCPVTPLEAMACGVKPLIYRWHGSDKYLPSYWTFKSLSELETLLAGDVDPYRYREYVDKNNNFSTMYSRFKEIIDELITGTDLHQSQDVNSGKRSYAHDQRL
jgi:glycosyltransferase involved in cell wall biosynthesis